MADSTPVNSQFTDAVTQQNAVHSQQALNQISSAVISKAVTMILSVGDKAA